jgi:alpha-N-acetylglucosaminidase
LSRYYVPRWQMFVNYLLEVPVTQYNYTELSELFLSFEVGWQTQGMNGTGQQTVEGQAENLQNILEGVVGKWDGIFRQS